MAEKEGKISRKGEKRKSKKWTTIIIRIMDTGMIY